MYWHVAAAVRCHQLHVRTANDGSGVCGIAPVLVPGMRSRRVHPPHRRRVLLLRGLLPMILLLLLMMVHVRGGGLRAVDLR